MFATLLNDWSQSCLNHTFEFKLSNPAVDDCAGPRTPDHDEQISVPRPGPTTTAAPANEPPIDFRTLFMASEGTEHPTAPRFHGSVEGPSQNAPQRRSVMQQRAVGAQVKVTKSRDYSVWTRAEEDEFHSVAADRADLPQKAFLEAVCQRVPTKNRSQVLGFYKRVETRLFGLVTPEDRQMLRAHVNLKHLAMSSHWRLTIEASGQSQHNGRRMLERLKADNKLDALQQPLQQEVTALRAVAAADKAAHEAGRARTAAQHALKKSGHHHHLAPRLLGAPQDSQQRRRQPQQWGSTPQQWRLQPTGSSPALPRLQACHQQQQYQQMQPQQLPQQQQLHFLAPLPEQQLVFRQQQQYHTLSVQQQAQLSQERQQQQQQAVSAAPTTSSPPNPPHHPSHGLSTTSGVAVPQTARRLTPSSSRPQDGSSFPHPFQCPTSESLCGSMVAVPSVAPVLPDVAPLQLLPMPITTSPSNTASTEDGSRRLTLQFMPLHEAAHQTAVASGASPFQQLTRIKPSKTVQSLAAHLHKKWGTPGPPSLHLSPAHAALPGAAQVGVFAATHPNTPKQLLYSWQPSSAAEMQETILPAMQPHSVASIPPASDLPDQPLLQLVAPPLVQPLAPPAAQVAVSVLSEPPAADPQLLERKTSGNKRGADDHLTAGPPKRRPSSSNSIRGLEPSRPSAISACPEAAPEAVLGVDPPRLPASHLPQSPQQQPGGVSVNELNFRKSIVDIPMALAPRGTLARMEVGKGLAGSPVRDVDVQGASKADSPQVTAFPELFGQQLSAAPNHQTYSQGQYPEACMGQGDALCNAPDSIPDQATRGFSTFFGVGELSSLAAEDSCNAFAAGGFNRLNAAAPSATSNRRAPGGAAEAPSSEGPPASRAAPAAGGRSLKDFLASTIANKRCDADMAVILQGLCAEDPSNMGLPSKPLGTATVKEQRACMSPPRAADRAVGSGSSPARSMVLSPLGRSRLGRPSVHSPVAFTDLTGIGGDGNGGGLSQLELDVGSFLGVGDGNSWDCVPKAPASAGSQADDHTDNGSLGAFHQLFSKT